MFDEQCCVNFCCAAKWLMCTYIPSSYFLTFFSIVIYPRILNIIPLWDMIRFYVNSAKPSRFRSSSLSFSCLFLIRCIKMTCILWTVRRLEWRRKNDIWCYLHRERPPGIRAYSTDKRRWVHFWMLLSFLALSPGLKSNLRCGENASPPAGTHACHQPCSLSSRDCQPPPGSCSHPLPPMSHPQGQFSEGGMSRRRCQNVKAVLFFPWKLTWQLVSSELSAWRQNRVSGPASEPGPGTHPHLPLNWIRDPDVALCKSHHVALQTGGEIIMVTVSLGDPWDQVISTNI